MVEAALQQETTMQTTIVKRSIFIAGRQTSVSLEDAFWNGLNDIARSQDVTASELVGDIDMRRRDGNLSSAIRLFVLAHFQEHPANASAISGTDIQSLHGEHAPPQQNGGGLP